METIRLIKGSWKYDPNKPIGPEGGFGAVFHGMDENENKVAVKRLKISAENAAYRELRIAGEIVEKTYNNVMPVLDSGQDANSERYFIVMPRAEKSLDYLIKEHGSLEEKESIEILLQIVNGLIEVSHLIHRDLKPGNILYYNEKWEVADFGIAKFVEESTSLRTLKGCLSPEYAAPEQWRLEKVTNATDIYALGCIGYTLLNGDSPFKGPSLTDFRYQHINEQFPSLDSIHPKLRSLLTMMARKTPDSRPSIQRVKTILTTFLDENASHSGNQGNTILSGVGAKIAEKESEEELQREKEKQEHSRRISLYKEAMSIFKSIRRELFEQIINSAPTAKILNSNKVILGDATLEMKELFNKPIDQGVFSSSGWDVIAGAVIASVQQNPQYVWSSSLWYAKQHSTDEYRWREVSYFANPYSKRRYTYEPHYLDSLEEADIALSSRIMGMFQVAWGPEYIDDENTEQFFNRWTERLAYAAQGQLSHPSRLPLK
ncbi:MAG TPA: serine/threonine-protein kinase [Bacteroidales bacterium]|nr:serine/threonine-protein kinase [Bacteroidales bacterium]